jgi:hypothetical protein
MQYLNNNLKQTNIAIPTNVPSPRGLGAWHGLNLQVLQKLAPPTPKLLQSHMVYHINTRIHSPKSLMPFCFSPNM